MNESSAEQFCTLFDLGYLPQGIALYKSLQRHVSKFTLWVLCMDKAVESALERMGLPNVKLIPLEEVETAELLAAKSTRSHGEYCWTLSPFLPKFILDHNLLISRVTYLDADTWLLKSPGPIFEEFEKSGKHVLYTEHGYAPEYDQAESSGKYCVQLLIYRNSKETRNVLNWWGNQCLDWCYARNEDGKMGDQKYLEQWQKKFPNETYVLQNLKFTLAPWNVTRFNIDDAIIYHFHGLRIFDTGRVKLWDFYSIPKPAFKAAYPSYISDITQATEMCRKNKIKLRLSKFPLRLAPKIAISRVKFVLSCKWGREYPFKFTNISNAIDAG